MATIITIDGPSGAGKGTVSRGLANKLGFHYLDSGALYRLLGLAAQRHRVGLDSDNALSMLAAHMDIGFKTLDDGSLKILLEGEDVSQELRTENTGTLASQVAAHPEVRTALFDRQRQFAKAPGLIADGRDMGTVVFPEAPLKIYLTASIEERAQRRYKELLDKGENVSLRALEEQVRSRDERDMNRDVSPLLPAEDAIELDTSELSIQEVMDTVLNLVYLKGLVKVIDQ
jgi:cytidylate kinase